MHPRDNLCYKAMQPRRSIPVSDFLRREQKSDTGMLSPLHLINARENGEGIDIMNIYSEYRSCFVGATAFPR